MLSKIKCIVPNFPSLSIAKRCEILLYGININDQLPDPRTIIITLEQFNTSILKLIVSPLTMIKSFLLSPPLSFFLPSS